ncbi:MAG: helicase-exonuclease AddAB subunit AddB [Selenomonadaceae bacterium]|nr:helicase-exonuclease AddAB subunit AddB [Selenomonadaceae bacterium]
MEIILGRGGTGKTAYCLQSIAAKLKASPMGKPLILLVPEHMTYKLEKELAALAPQGQGFLRAYVFGFRRFARQILLETGGGVLPRMTEVGRRMLLKKILVERGESLTMFQRAAKQRGFTKTLSTEIQELKSYALTPEKLQQGAENLNRQSLGRKLKDLAILLRDFNTAMEGRYNDNEDLMQALAEHLPMSEMIKGAEFWLDGFVFFNPQERQVLTQILHLAAEVHITLSLAREDSSPENTRLAGIFHRAWDTKERLKQLAASLGLAVKITRLNINRRFAAKSLALLEGQMFQLGAKPHNDKGGLRLIEAANRRVEAEAVCADIQRLCREEGYRYRDIGILVRDDKAYGRLLELILEDYGIPFFRDAKSSAAHHPLAELLRSAFEVLRGWRYEPIFRVLRTGFFPLGREQVDVLENYVLEFGLKGAKRWLMAEDWPWYRRGLEDYALTEEEAVKREETLATVNFLRREIIKPLADFAAKVKKSVTVRDFTTAAYELLTTLNVTARLEEWSKEAERQGRLTSAAQHQQIWQDIMELFDQMVQAGGDDAMDVEEYEALLVDGLDALEISLIPPGLDYVTVAAFDQNSLENTKAIYIVGCNEGIMPRRSRERGLFSDAERLHLAEAGIELPGGGQESSFSERYLLYRGFTAAKEYLWVSYALADEKGEGLNPSSLLLNLRALLPQTEFLSLPLDMEEGGKLDPAAVLRLGGGSRAVSRLAGALRQIREGREIAPWWQDVYNWTLTAPEVKTARGLALAGIFAKAATDNLPLNIAAGLFLKKNRLRGSVTRFENFNSCPFQHFARYGLRLQERREHRFRSLELGTLLHSVLSNFGQKLKKAGRRWREVTEEECSQMCRSIVEELAPKLNNEILLSTAQYRHQLERIRTVAEHSLKRLIAFDAVSLFHPEAFEESFGRGIGSLPPLVYELSRGSRLEISGQIDRLDLDESGAYFLIIDYKTGQAAVNLLEVYYGLKLQLLTYLLVANNLMNTPPEKRLPAGMLYCFLKYPLIASRQKMSVEAAKEKINKELKMPGWILADPEVVKAIDATQNFIKVRLTKSDGIYSSDRAKVKTMAEFEILLNYVDYLLPKTGERILAGEVAPSPCRLRGMNPCAYCDFAALCGFDPDLPGFAYNDLEVHEDAETMDAMELAPGSE